MAAGLIILLVLHLDDASFQAVNDPALKLALQSRLAIDPA